MSNFLLHLAQSSGGVRTAEPSLPRAEPVTQPSALATPDLSAGDPGLEESSFGEHEAPAEVSPIHPLDLSRNLEVSGEPVHVEPEPLTPGPRPPEASTGSLRPKTLDSPPEISIEPAIVTPVTRTAESPAHRTVEPRPETPTSEVNQTPPEPQARDAASSESTTTRVEPAPLPSRPPEVETAVPIVMPGDTSTEPEAQATGNPERTMPEVIVPEPVIPESPQPESLPADSSQTTPVIVVEPSLRPLAPESLPVIEPAPQPVPVEGSIAPKAAPEPRPVQVRIGRVEVKAKAPSTPEPPAPAPISRGFGRYQHLRTYARRLS